MHNARTKHLMQSVLGGSLHQCTHQSYKSHLFGACSWLVGGIEPESTIYTPTPTAHLRQILFAQLSDPLTTIRIV